MYKIIDKRGTGKTLRLMLLAKENNGIVVCSSPIDAAIASIPTGPPLNFSIIALSINNFLSSVLIKASPLYNNKSGSSQIAHCKDLFANLGKNNL